MKLISFKAPNTVIEDLDELVRGGVYSSRSEAIRMIWSGAMEILLFL
ncbi:MAG: ribbon-helix-helix domain-containing protein [Candidatus Hodarchaeales archaeon]